MKQLVEVSIGLVQLGKFKYSLTIELCLKLNKLSLYNADIPGLDWTLLLIAIYSLLPLCGSSHFTYIYQMVVTMLYWHSL